MRSELHATRHPASTWARASWPCFRKIWTAGRPTPRPTWISGRIPAAACTGRATPSKSSRPVPISRTLPAAWRCAFAPGRMASRWNAATSKPAPPKPSPRANSCWPREPSIAAAWRWRLLTTTSPGFPSCATPITGWRRSTLRCSASRRATGGIACPS